MNKRVLITGGASGLGRAIAEVYLSQGARVLITDINLARGEAAVSELQKKGDIHFVAANTCVDGDWDRLVSWCQDQWGGLDVLVNNAGVVGAGRIDKISMEDWDWIIDINLKGVVRGCRTFTPVFKQQGNGQIINIASLAAVVCAPAMSSYNVTKAAVLALSETLRHELGSYGISVCVVCPSFFQTNLAESLRTPEDGLDSTVKKLLAGGKLTAHDVAKRIVTGANKKQFLVLPHTEGKLIALTKRLLPPVLDFGLSDAGRRMKKRFDV